MTGYFNDREAMIGVLRGLPDLAIAEGKIRSINKPVLSVVGERDPMLVGAETTRRFWRYLVASDVQFRLNAVTNYRLALRRRPARRW